MRGGGIPHKPTLHRKNGPSRVKKRPGGGSERKEKDASEEEKPCNFLTHPSPCKEKKLFPERDPKVCPGEKNKKKTTMPK